MKPYSATTHHVLFLLWLVFCCTAQAEDDLPLRIRGDVGGAIYMGKNPVHGQSNTVLAVPYTYFDYGRLFARFDTFGVKTLPLGYGYLEFSGRINLDGYQATHPSLRGINGRMNSAPLGIGTFQETPIGGFFLNAFYDLNPAHGQLYELIYAAQFEAGKTVLYPMFGLEHYSAGYTRYYYGVSSAEAARSNYPAYTPAAATTPMLGGNVELPLGNHLYASLYVLRRWLGASISDSPLVRSTLQDEAFVSFSYRYK